MGNINHKLNLKVSAGFGRTGLNQFEALKDFLVEIFERAELRYLRMKGDANKI